jgi:hypothetical protein
VVYAAASYWRIRSGGAANGMMSGLSSGARRLMPCPFTRNPYVQKTSPVWLGWGSAGLAYLQVNLHEQNGLPFKPTDSSCLVYPFYVTILPG